MNKRFLLAISLSFVSVWAIQYFLGKHLPQAQQAGQVTVGEGVAPGQAIRVASTQDLYRPLNTTIEFTQEKNGHAEELTPVETKRYKAVFSNRGAILTTLDFKEHRGKNGVPLRTIYNKGGYEDEQRKKGCFLLALEQQTPFNYHLAHTKQVTVNSLHDKNKKEEGVEVAYHAENDQWVVHKTYTLHQERYQIDLRIELEPKGQNIAATRARLFFAGPSVNEIADDSVTSFVLNETKDSLEKFETGKAENLAWHWGTPRAIIGAEDKYFVHTLVRDSTHFVQRAYVKTFDPKNTFPVLESAEIKEKKQWDLSFYFGPKVFDHLSDADDKLEDLLSFGWLSWLCKVLLKLLDYLFDLIGNYGLAIIVLTILLKLPFAPLSIYGRKRMEEYQRYQPTIQRIRAKYKHDMKMQHEELMKFHKDHNLSTSTPILGCLPLLIQMPILFALYRVLNSYLDLYQAPFVGWLIDLSSKDPYYVLPIAMGVSMIWQQKMTPMADEKQRVIMLFMAIVMTVVFANFPAGLVLYWLMNNLLTIAEDYVRKLFFS